MKLKIGDKVKVLSGKDSGREGEIERIFPKDGKILIPGLNIYKKHVKGAQGQKGGVYELPRPLLAGKVMLICPKCKKPSRVGNRLAGDEKVRFCRRCGKEIDGK